MLEQLIVLGLVPGTHFQITFNWILLGTISAVPAIRLWRSMLRERMQPTITKSIKWVTQYLGNVARHNTLGI